MARQLTDLNEILGNFVSDGDYLLLRDMSDREDKKIKIEELGNALFLSQHRVGSVYITYSEADDPNLRGGTWQLASKGRSIIGVDPDDSDFNQPDYSGGNKKHSHPLSSKGVAKVAWNDQNYFGIEYGSTLPPWVATYRMPSQMTATATSTVYNAGASLAGATDDSSSMHPWETAFVWRRTA